MKRPRRKKILSDQMLKQASSMDSYRCGKANVDRQNLTALNRE